MDFSAEVGTPIKASCAGIITFVGYDAQYPGRGLHIWRDNENGTRTVSMHLSAVDVQVGQHIDPGDTIGSSGDSGLNFFTSTSDVQVAPHYHEGLFVAVELGNGYHGFVDWKPASWV